jgi:hypothetical protein
MSSIINHDYRQKYANYLPFIQLLVANNAYNNIPTSIRKFLFISDKNTKLLLVKNNSKLLIQAINENNIPMVKLLLDNGANVNIHCYNRPLLHYTIANKTNHEIIRLLLNSGADMYTINGRNTALIVSIIWNNIEAAKLLLAKGYNINTKSAVDKIYYRLWPPLIYAIMHNNLELVKLFINSGADINLCADFNGNTPLIAAVKIKNIKIIKLLLKSGADIYIADHNRYTALDWAIKEFTFSRSLPNIIFKVLPPINYVYNSYYILMSFQPFVNKHNRKELLTYLASINHSYQSDNKIGMLFKIISHNKFRRHWKMYINSFLSNDISSIIIN